MTLKDMIEKLRRPHLIEVRDDNDIEMIRSIKSNSNALRQYHMCEVTDWFSVHGLSIDLVICIKTGEEDD